MGGREVGEPPRSRGGEAGEEAMRGRVSDNTKVGTGRWLEEGLEGVAAGVVALLLVEVVCMDKEVEPLDRGEEEVVATPLAGL